MNTQRSNTKPHLSWTWRACWSIKARASRMSKQCKLSNKDFGLLIACRLDRDTYEAKLIAQSAVESQSV
ncbi:MAG: hypothetical protein RL358_1159 [Pseudomonadota bacterium]|jgi:hypothetical protein